MNRRVACALSLIIGIFAFSSAQAFATNESVPVSPTQTEASGKPVTVTVSQSSGAPGTEVYVKAACGGGSYVTSDAVTLLFDGFVWEESHDGAVMGYRGTVKNVEAGEYSIDLRCHIYSLGEDRFASTAFTVRSPAAAGGYLD